ncbi:MAG: carbohydrate ABC transporter permease [Candidatus Scatosoma sp.]
MAKKIKEKVLRSRPEMVVLWTLVIIFSIYSVTLIFPFLWIFINSFKTTGNFVKDIWGWPSPFVGKNWIDAFQLTVPNVNVNLLGMFGNTLIFVVVNVGTSLFFNAISAYVVAKYDFKIMKVIHSVAIVFMVVPLFGSIATLYKFVVDANLYDTYFGVVFISASFFNSTFLFLYAYFKNLSWAYAEAAFIDGAGHARVFFQIMMPMSIPAIGSLGILGVIGTWNEFFNVYMYAPSKATIGVGLNALSSNIRGEYPKLFAAMIISLLPIVTVFCAFQKTIMENVSFGGLKG